MKCAGHPECGPSTPYKVLLFEKSDGPISATRRNMNGMHWPRWGHHSRHATFASYWRDADLELPPAAESLPTPKFEATSSGARARNRELLFASPAGARTQTRAAGDAVPSVHRRAWRNAPAILYLGRASSDDLVALQIEDLIGRDTFRVTGPGTCSEYPNLARKVRPISRMLPWRAIFGRRGPSGRNSPARA